VKVFVSWSGDVSRHVAETLHDKIRLVITDVDPWMSSQSINAGTRWRDELSTRLKATRFGIVFVTRANQHAPWLNFEAGALATAIDASRVVPLSIDLSPAEISGPMSEFQAQPLSQEGLRRLFLSMNELREPPLATDLINTQLSVWDPRIESEARSHLEDAQSNDASDSQVVRSDRELLEEVVEGLRRLSQRPASKPDISSRIMMAHLTADRLRDFFHLSGRQELSVNNDFAGVTLTVSPGDKEIPGWMLQRAEEIAQTYGMSFSFDETPF
jgi:hypothetical protein